MSYSPEQLVKIATNYDQLAVTALIAEAKKKEKKKLDPKAKVRNRGTVCVPASSAKDKKDHFPINDEGQARNALARVQQYSSVPEWYSGSLKGLQALVSRKVHSKYPSIGKADKKKSSSVEVDRLLNKYGQDVPASQPPAQDETEEQFVPQRDAPMDFGTNRANPPIPDKDPSTYSYNTKALLHGDPGPMNPPPAQNAPAAQAKPAGRGGWTGAKIDPKMQTLLGVNADGKLGPQTQAALDRYKVSRNPNMTNELAFEYLKREPEYATGAAMRYDDNSNTYTRRAGTSLEDLMKRYG